MTIGSISSELFANTAYSKEGDNAKMGKEEFLKLLITQMQHQDPLEPMQNHEFVAQLATFSNVEQLISVNEGIGNLASLQSAAYDTQASGFIGKTVDVMSNQLNVNGSDTSIQTGFALGDNADTVIVNIRDASGQVARSMNMGPHAAGNVEISWNLLNNNGVRVPPGAYQIDVVASNSNGTPIPYQTRVRGYVDGISYESGTPQLIIGATRASVSNIIGVYPGNISN